MKKKGSITECNAQRNAELVKAMRQQLRDAQCLQIQQMAAQAANTPASRYWVSEERAAVVVSLLRRGKNPLEGMRPAKQRMFRDIYERVMLLQAERPGSSLVDLVSMVIYRQAPEFYVAPIYAQQLWYENQRSRRSGRAEA